MFNFKTIESAVENTLLKEKGSKFLGFAFPVNNEEELKHALEKIRAEHPKATHHCYAFRMGLNGENYRANDDGEPSGSADFRFTTSYLPMKLRMFWLFLSVTTEEQNWGFPVW